MRTTTTALKTTTALNEQVDAKLLKKAERIWARNGMKRVEAINILIAQTIVRNNFPIVIGADDNGEAMRSTKEQLNAWDDAFGEY